MTGVGDQRGRTPSPGERIGADDQPGRTPPPGELIGVDDRPAPIPSGPPSEGGACALVTGAVVGLVANALSPPPVYYAPPVVYAQPGVVYAQPGVVYQDGPSRTVIYNNPPPGNYVRDDGYSN